GSRADLEQQLDRPVEAISYPIGRSIADSPALCDAVRRAGYRIGFSNHGGTNARGRSVAPLDVHRIPMGLDLAQPLSRALMALPGSAVQAREAWAVHESTLPASMPLSTESVRPCW